MSVETIGADTTNTRGTVITASGSANTKGSWTELSASTSTAATAAMVTIFCANTQADYLVDIGTGAAASETAVIADIQTNRPTISITCRQFFIPISIASGTRVSARCQSSTAAATCRIIIHLFSGTANFLGGTSVVTYGANTTDSGGTEVDPGGTINTKGSYVEITASTSADIEWLTVIAGGRTNGAKQNAEFLLDVATGAGGAESDIISNIYFTESVTINEIDNVIGMFPVSIASGTRIAVRAQCTINDATDRLFDIVLLGSDATAVGGSGGGGFSAFMGR